MAYGSRKSNPYTGKGGPGKNRPAVTAKNTEKYTDYDKKSKAMHGVGAKLFAKGTPERAEQDAMAASKVKEYRQKTGEFPTLASQVKHDKAGLPPMPGQYVGVVQNSKKKKKSH